MPEGAQGTRNLVTGEVREGKEQRVPEAREAMTATAVPG